MFFQWTCVHDIQEKDSATNETTTGNEQSAVGVGVLSDSERSNRESQTSVIGARRKISLRRNESSTESRMPHSRDTSRTDNSSATNLSSQPLQAASPPFIMSVAVDRTSETDSLSSIQHNSRNSTEETEHLSHDRSEDEGAQAECPSDVDSHEEDETEQSPASPSHFSPAHSVTLGESVTFIIRSGAQVAERTLLLLGQSQPPRSHNLHIHHNKQRLTHYIQEPNAGRGFIKEINFSNDGRLICSPFGFGLRLLAFGPECQELCDLQPERPMQLYELTSNMSHVNSVVASKFSPTHCLLVTGCLNGKVDFHQPVL